MADEPDILTFEAVGEASTSNELVRFLLHLGIDTAKNLSLILSLLIIYFAAKGLQFLGVEQKDTQAILRLHFWTTYACLGWVGIQTFATLVRHGLKQLFRGA